MLEALVKAAEIPKYQDVAGFLDQPIRRQHALIIGGTHLLALAGLFPNYALEATVVIPSEVAELDRDHEFGRAVDFEEANPKVCRGVGIARDLGGFDSDSVDLLILCTDYPQIRDEFLKQAHRVLRDSGKLIVFTPAEISLSHLNSFGIGAPIYYPVEGFYVGTMRQAGSLYRRN